MGNKDVSQTTKEQPEKSGKTCVLDTNTQGR
jgi:hypothetical protein